MARALCVADGQDPEADITIDSEVVDFGDMPTTISGETYVSELT